MISTPYFLKNKSWCDIQIINGKPVIKMTDKAPKKAIDSYNDYMKTTKKGVK